MHRICYVSLFIFLIINPVVVSAEELSVEKAIEIALSNSPLVAEIDSNFAKEKREAKDLGILPNPELDAEIQFYNNGAPDATSNQPSVAITQPFRLSHFGLREKVSKLKEKAAKQGKEVELIVFFQRVRLAFARCWLLNQRKNFISDVLANANKISNFVESGFKETVFGTGEREIFRSEVARLKAEVLGLEAEIAKANSEFNILTGDEASKYEFLEPKLIEPNSEIIKHFEEGKLKIQDRTQVLLNISEQEKKLAERDAFPELRPRILYAGTNDSGEFYGVGITFALPLFNRNQNAIEEADALKKSAAKTATYYKSKVFRSQLIQLKDSIINSIQQLNLYKSKVIPSLDKAFKAYNQQLRSGQGDVLRVWQVSVSLNDNYERYTELWIRTFSERTELSILLQEDF